MASAPTSPCDLSNFTLQLSVPHAPHNQQAREIFTTNFIQATNSKLYSIACITGALFHEDRISRAFDRALRVQVQIQLLADADKSYQEIHEQERRDAVKLGVR
jgi:phosphatidylserine/phosphatidylglycerophosphate/cardiolipin synthase-like enzyme